MTEFSFVLACKVEKVVEFDFSSLLRMAIAAE